MGPRPLGRGRDSTPAPSLCRNPWRQWGRDLSAAEGRVPRRDERIAQAASMGPRPLGRGRVALPGAAAPAPPCVNGAATSRPRKVPALVAGAVRAVEASMGPRPLGRGRLTTLTRLTMSKMASMGPRPLGRGRTFNASVDSVACPERQWGRDLSAAEGKQRTIPRAPRARVNGAATSRPRKAVISTQRMSGCGASMGPRPLGRGRSKNGRAGSGVCCVNGAATSRPRKAC